MTEISSAASRIAKDLSEILKGLSNSRGTDTAQLIEQTITPDLMDDFKRAADAMRRLLWIYVDAGSRATLCNPSQAPENLQQAIELLRSLREDGVPLRQQLSGDGSFTEQVEALLAYYSAEETLAA